MVGAFVITSLRFVVMEVFWPKRYETNTMLYPIEKLKSIVGEVQPEDRRL